MIATNLEKINANIAQAAAKSGRCFDDIALVAVTKSVDSAQLREHAAALINAGVLDLGENRVQELLEKQPVVEGFNWHMIGHLQRNKVKQVLERVTLIHSLDSLRLAEEISRVAARLQVTADVLIEINIAMESTKYGIAPEDTADFARLVQALPNINIKGLMTIAPFVDDGEENRPHFRRMAQLLEKLNIKGADVLSMGMTIDYEAAIEEGANIIRIGTAIFG